MKKMHVYFIHQCKIQYYDYNAAEGSHEFRFKNLHSFDKIFKYWEVKVSI
jgi:hypothetical protein